MYNLRLEYLKLRMFDITGVYLCDSLLRKTNSFLKKIDAESEYDIFIIQQIVAEIIYGGSK